MIACLLSLVACRLSLVACAWYAFANACICLFVCVGLCVCVCIFVHQDYVQLLNRFFFFVFLKFYCSSMVHSHVEAIIAEHGGRHEGLLVGRHRCGI